MAQAVQAISADSHICETEDCFARIDPAFESRRPRAIHDEQRGALLEIEDLGVKVPMGIVCTAGRPPEKFGDAIRWEDLHPASYDPTARLAIQDEEGVAAELLYPSLGMVLCNHPDLQVVCVESDAGWVPHFKFRMDHAYERHRFHLGAEKLERTPSTYFDSNIYMTFQDDYSVKQVKDGLNLDRVMWATDFPHSDGTYPHSGQVMAQVTKGMSEAERAKLLRDNAAQLYGIAL